MIRKPLSQPLLGADALYQDDWEELAKLLGYQLYGWTYNHSAILERPNGSLLTVTDDDRLAITTLYDKTCVV